MKKLALVVAAAISLPGAAQAQSSWFQSAGPTYPGFYIGAQGGANWLLNNQSYVMDTGWAAGAKVGYDFVGPRFALEGMYHSNTGTAVVIFPTGYANVRGRIEQVSVMANALYDFFPGAMVTPYIGAGAGVAFVDANIQGCSLCLTMFAYQGILGLGYNATPAMRIGLEGRYYGTTNPGAYFNNNIGAVEPEL
jgi:OOP family OmpA-OmpF porin